MQKTKTHLGFSARRGKVEKFVRCNGILVYWIGQFYMETRNEERKKRVVSSNALSILNFKYVLILVVVVVFMKLIICRVAD